MYLVVTGTLFGVIGPKYRQWINIEFDQGDPCQSVVSSSLDWFQPAVFFTVLGRHLFLQLSPSLDLDLTIPTNVSSFAIRFIKPAAKLSHELNRVRL
jgi:hypothetical protein